MYVPADKDKCAEFSYQKGNWFNILTFTLLFLFVEGTLIETDKITSSNPAGKNEYNEGWIYKN